MTNIYHNFHTPPCNQGQIVLVSYACRDGSVIRKTVDQSDGTMEYAISRMLASDEGDYWNAAPPNKRWRKITAESMSKVLEE